MLASLFVVGHLLEFPRFLDRLGGVPDHLQVSVWAGKIGAILIGTAIAIACFKKRKPKDDGNTGQQAMPPPPPVPPVA